MTRARHIRILIADGSRAAAFETPRLGGPMELVWQVDSEDARRPTREVGVERPGRVQESANDGRHAMSPRVDWHRQAEDAFLRDVVTRLGDDHAAAPFDALALIAAPRALGVLRAQLPPALAALVRHEFAKDLTKIPASELPAHLAALTP
jgi:protein required for attachment to host cells